MYWTVHQEVQWKGPTHPIAVPTRRKNAILPPSTSRELFTTRAVPHYRLEMESGCSNRPYLNNLIRNVPGAFRYSTPGIESNATDALNHPQSNCEQCVPHNSRKIALDKVRRISNGRKNWNPATGTSTTFQTTREYLHNRAKLFDQNNFHYIQSGDSSALPGTTQASDNVYRTGGISSCSKYFISAELQNHTFTYIWTDGETYTAEFPDGWYTLAMFQNAWEGIQRDNHTYFLNEATGEIYYLIRFTHNSAIDRISLSIVDPSIYADVGTNQIAEVDEPTDISVSLEDSMLGEDGLGFPSAVYTGYGVHNSSTLGRLATTYYRTYYNPSNPQYATTHAVPSSDRLLRLQYNTINKTAATYLEPYGHGNAVAMAYGVMRNARVEKDKHNHPYYTSKLINGEWVCVRDCHKEHSVL
jgi:hypothetical protein